LEFALGRKWKLFGKGSSDGKILPEYHLFMTLFYDRATERMAPFPFHYPWHRWLGSKKFCCKSSHCVSNVMKHFWETLLLTKTLPIQIQLNAGQTFCDTTCLKTA
jgi:hypothetical protein